MSDRGFLEKRIKSHFHPAALRPSLGAVLLDLPRMRYKEKGKKIKTKKGTKHQANRSSASAAPLQPGSLRVFLIPSCPVSTPPASSGPDGGPALPLSAFNLALTPRRSPARSCGKRGAESKAGSGANGSWMGGGGREWTRRASKESGR